MEPGRRRTPTNWGRRATPLDEPLLTPSPGGSTDDGSGDDVAAPSPFALPPSPSPAGWSRLRRDLRVRDGEIYVSPPTGERPVSSSGVPLLRDRHLFHSLRHGTPVSGPRSPGFAVDPFAASDSPGDSHPSSDADARDDRDGRVRIAAEYVVDAIEGLTHLTFRRDSPAARAIAKAQRSPLYPTTIRLVLLAILALIFFEPHSRRAVDVGVSSLALWRRLLAGEMAAATVLAATVVADVVRLGGERWRAKHWRFVFAAVTVAIWIDAAVCLAATCVAERRAPPWLLSRPTRCLRPLLLVAHVRPLRQLVSSALKTIPRLAPTVSLVGTVVVAWSALGVQLYQGRYDVADADTRGNFDNAFDASVAMTVLITTENFPDVMRPALAVGGGGEGARAVPKPVTAVFFVSFIVVGVWLGMSLWVSVIFATYKSQHRRKIAKQRVHEQKALITAFAVLQDSPDEPLDGETWISLALVARPGLKPAAARALLAVVDRDGDGAVDVDDFLLTVDALKSGVSRVRDLTPLVTSRVAPGFGPIPEVTVEPEDGEAMVAKAKATLASVAQSRTLDACSRALAFAQTLVAVARHRGASRAFDAVVDIADVACVLALSAEVALHAAAARLRVAPARVKTRGGWRAVGGGWRGFARAHGFDAALAVVGLAALAPGVPARWFRRTTPFRVLRLISTSPAQREIVATFGRCGEVIATLLTCLACVVYGYGCVGMEMFSSQVTSPRVYCGAGMENAETPATPDALPCLDRLENFEAPWNACLALFQVSTTNNWHQILYPNAAALADTFGDAGRVVAVFYFVSFYILTVMLLVNILTSLVLEMFGLAWRSARAGGGDEDDDGIGDDETSRRGDGENAHGDGDGDGDGDGPRARFVEVRGERWMVTRPNDWAKDLMLEGLSVRRERAALARGLEQLETQLARRRNERVSAALAELRRRRERESPGGSARGGSSALRRTRSAAYDLAGELEELTDEEWAHMAALMGTPPENTTVARVARSREG